MNQSTLQEFISRTYDNPEGFRCSITDLLEGNMGRPYWEKALSGLHPLFTGNRGGRVLSALADVWEVRFPDVIAYYESMPRDRKIVLETILSEVIEQAVAYLPEDILAADPILTERLYRHEAELRLFLHCPPRTPIKWDPRLLVVALFKALNLNSSGMRISNVLTYCKKLPLADRQRVSASATNALLNTSSDLTQSLRADLRDMIH